METTNTDKNDPFYKLAVFDTDDGQVLVELFSDGQVHIAFRQHQYETWSAGYWTIAKHVDIAPHADQ